MPRRAPGFEKELLALGLEVARRRSALGLTQPELADRAGISLDGLLTIEKGRSAPTAVTLILLGRALGCRGADLLSAVDASPAKPRDLSGIFELLENQRPDVVTAAEACVRAIVRLASKPR